MSHICDNPRIDQSKYIKPGNTHSFQPKKLLFLIPIILGIGLMVCSSIGGIGLFGNHSPQWLANIIDNIRNACSNKMLWTMLIGGGVLGLAGYFGGIYGLAKPTSFELKDKYEPEEDYIGGIGGISEDSDPIYEVID